MHWQSRRDRFRAHLENDRCLFPGSVYDPVSARMAEDIGFEIGMFAGSVASLTVLGDPDHILLTLSEFAQQAYRINRAATLPLLVDADHGYGNALNVMRTVEELETAGVAALSIEDTDLPLPFGATGKSRLIPLEEGVGKIRAAVAARQDPGLVIAARTSALLTDGMDEALRRIDAYQQTGADALFLLGVKEPEQLAAVAAHCRLPLILGGAGPAIMDASLLGASGVRICLQGHQPVMAAMQAAYSTLLALRNGEEPATLPGLPEKSLVDRYTRKEEFDDRINRFLG